MNTADSSKVSVIIPCWGSYTKHLSNAINSVRDQAAEIIVVGNQEAVNIAADEGVHAISAPRPFAVSTARRSGLQAARTPLVCLLDSDDTVLPGKLQLMALTLARHPAAIAISGCLGDENNLPVWPSKRLAKLVATKFGAPLLLYKNVLGINGVCVAYRDNMLAAMVNDDYEDEDWHSALKLRRQGKVIFVPEVMVTYNRRDGSRSRQDRSYKAVKKSHDELIISALDASRRHSSLWKTIDILARIPRAYNRFRTLRRWNTLSEVIPSENNWL